MTAGLLLAVAFGGLLGAPSRYLLDRYVSRHYEANLPWGTFIVNVTGSFLLGLLTGLATAGNLAPIPLAVLGTGFCGAYTTFSTFTFETIRMVEDGRYLEALMNLGMSIALGLAAATTGVALGLLT